VVSRQLQALFEIYDWLSPKNVQKDHRVVPHRRQPEKFPRYFPTYGLMKHLPEGMRCSKKIET
jgi:hypothetical protein